MMLPVFIEKARIRGNEILQQTITNLNRLYNTSRDSFSYSGSWGQLVLVYHNLHQVFLHYLSDARTEMNPLQAKRNNSIYGNASLTGHNVPRNRTARGELQLTFISENANKLNGSKIYLPNFSKIRCLSNGLVYSVDLGSDDTIIDVNATNLVSIRIMEGVWEFQIFTGTGAASQSFEVNTPNGRQIDDHHYSIEINSKQAKRYSTIFEIPFGELGYTARTGIYSGIDVLFGDDIAHEIPVEGAEIRVDYLITNGLAGNISDLDSSWEWVDSAFDSRGEEVDLNELFEVRLSNPCELGVNAEPPEITRRVSAMYPQTELIHDKKTIQYAFERLNMFNIVKVFRADELTGNDKFQFQYMVLAIPKLADRVTGAQDYFSIDINNFKLTSTEKVKILNSLEESGRKSAAISINFTDFIIKRFVAFVWLEIFEYTQGSPVDKRKVKIEARNALNEYLISNPRLNKIPHSDIVKLFDNIEAIDSAKVSFFSELNADGANNVGIDTMGNINLKKNEVAVIRGGWQDVDENVYEDTFTTDDDRLATVNFFMNVVPNIV